AVASVRRYLAQAKLAEARAVTESIAKSYAEAVNVTPPPGKPMPKKKLVSLPAVPQTVPRGTRYQSAPGDWTAWDAIHFSMGGPQYYQYEVVAAKDGQSADVIARGDLNGDGKTSEIKRTIHVDPKTKQVVYSAEELSETNPLE